MSGVGREEKERVAVEAVVTLVVRGGGRGGSGGSGGNSDCRGGYICRGSLCHSHNIMSYQSSFKTDALEDRKKQI